MKKLGIILLVASCAMAGSVSAQNVENGENHISDKQEYLADSLTNLRMNTECSMPQETLPQPYTRRSYMPADVSLGDSIHLPVLNMQGQVPLMTWLNDSWYGLDQWTLHKGLNMNLGASVFAAFGKGAPKGAGFGQDLSLMYAMPLSGKLTLAVGGWISNAYWGNDRYTDAGLNAVLGYKFNDHWEAYVYGRKSIMNKPVPHRFYNMQELGDRIGAAVKYNFSPSCSVQISVSAGKCSLPDDNDFTMHHSER